VSVTTFIGNRRAVQSSTARSLFCARELQGFLEQLDFEDLAPEQPLEFAHALLCPAQVCGRDYVIIGAYGLLATPGHQAPPSEHEARGEPVASSNVADRHARLHRLGDDGQFLFCGEAAPACDAGDDLDLKKTCRT
jgi:hypothetical protein